MTHQISQPLTSLYEQDYCLWLEQTIEQLQTGELSKIDLLALIEELQGMSNSEKTALEGIYKKNLKTREARAKIMED
jgi:hypothetical protein